MISNASSHPSGRPLSDTAIAWLLFLVVVAVYFSTACRTIYTGDDGDFASAVATLGVPHPTGYPLFILVGKLWITLTAFAGSVPFRLNLMTATCGAGAVAVLYRFLSELFAGMSWRRIWAVVGALIFAFSPTMWNQSSSCEVYAPNVLFLGLLLWLSVRFIRAEPGDDANKKLCLLALAYGFALTNHLTIALFFPAFMVMVIWRKPSLFGKDWQILLAVVGCLLLPLSLYIYLPLATKFSSSPNKWGYPDTPERFWAHVTGGQYHTLMFVSGSAWKAGGKYYLTDLLPHEYGAILLIVAATGLGFLLWNPRTRVHALLLMAIFAGDIAYSAGYNIVDIFVYYVPSYLVLAVCIAGAGSGLVYVLEAKLGAATMNRYAKLAFPAFLAAVALHASVHYADANKSDNRAEADYAESILRSCPTNGVLVARGSVAQTIWYYQFVEKMRPDVLTVSTELFPGVVSMGGWYRWHLDNRDPRFSGYIPQHLASPDPYSDGSALVGTLQNAIRDGRPVVIAPIPNLAKQVNKYVAEERAAGRTPTNLDWWVIDQAVAKSFDRVPWGLTERLYPKGTAPSPDIIVRETSSLWTGENPPIRPNWKQLAAVSGQDSLQMAIFFRFWDSATEWGALAEAAKRPDLAIPAYQNALSLYGDDKVSAELERLKKQVSVPVSGNNP